MSALFASSSYLSIRSLRSADPCSGRELLAQMGLQFASVSGSNWNPPENRIKFEKWLLQPFCFLKTTLPSETE